MPMLSPGVEVKEQDLTIIVPILGNATAAFAGVFTKGPSDKYLLITNGEELITHYGKPTNGNYNDWFQAYNYLQYANKLLISRAVDANGTFKETEVQVTLSNEIGKVEIDRIGQLQAGHTVKFDVDSEEEFLIKEIETDIVAAVAQVDNITVNGNNGTATDGEHKIRLHKEDGTYEDLVFTASNNTTDEVASGLANAINNESNTPVTAEASTNGAGIVTVTANTAGQPFTIDIVTTNNLSIANVTENVPADSYELVFDDSTDFAAMNLNGKVVLLKDAATNALVCAPKEGFEPKSAAELKMEEIFIANSDEFEVEEQSIPITGDTKLKFIAKSSGSLMNKIGIAIARESDFDEKGTEAFKGLMLNSFFETKPSEARREIAILIEQDGEVISTYIVSLDPDSKDYRNKSNYIEDVINKYDELVYVIDNEEELTMPASRLFTSSSIALDGTVVQEVDNILRTSNGSDGEVNHGDIEIAYGSVSDNSIFGNKEEIDIDIVIGNEAARVAAGKLAYERADCIAFLGSRFEDVVGLKSTIIIENLIKDVEIGELGNSSVTNSFCATFGNYKYQYDKFNDKFRWVSFAGDAAGLRADTNSKLQTWWASAGIERGQIKNTQKLAFNPNVGQRDFLYKNKINPIVSFPGLGNSIIWGQKTLQSKASAFDRINVRGLFNTLERAISRMAKFYLFEFNDEFTRNRFVASITPFLEGVKAGRGVYDFYIRCDETNNTPEVIDSNRFIADIAVKPTRVAEFITLNFIATGTGIDFREMFI